MDYRKKTMPVKAGDKLTIKMVATAMGCGA